ncbi:MAG: hypothetical protein IJL39_06700, partial [Clostridia bacterium]|nr:hypothetical protein [Clostridia bacterium]
GAFKWKKRRAHVLVSREESMFWFQMLPEFRDKTSARKRAACCYLAFFVLPVLADAKESRFLEFHAIQGSLLLTAELLFFTALGLVNRAALFLLPWSYYRRGLRLLRILTLCPIPFCFLGAAAALGGKALSLPILGWAARRLLERREQKRQIPAEQRGAE